MVYHPSPAGLYVHGSKLLDLFNAYPPDNPVVFDSIPHPPAEAIDDSGRYSEIRVDEWGTVWRHLIFGVWGHPMHYPFHDWEEAATYAFPDLPTFDAEALAHQRKGYLLFAGTISIFERLHALQPMEHVLLDILTEKPSLLRFIDRLMEYWLNVIDRMINSGIDVIMFGDDWGGQTAPLIPPSIFHKMFVPRYKTLMAPIRAANRRIFFHSCGFLGEILDALLELGINGLWPQLGFFDEDPTLFEKCRKNRVTLYIHPDRQYLVPRGTPEEIQRAIKSYAERFHHYGGGGIFYVEVENDAPFENIETLLQSIHRFR